MQLLCSLNDLIMAGHGRVLAAKQLGMKEVPVVKLSHLTAEQIKAYTIADNKIAENAGWDHDLLAIEFEALSSLELDFDLDITGFEMAEIDLLIDGLDVMVADSADEIIEIDENVPAVTQLGDVWQCGKHRIYCGDATDSESYTLLMEGKTAHAVVSDPPYNVPIDGHVCGLGKIKHKEFAMASGEMSEEQFTAMLSTVCEQLIAHSKDGSLHYLFMDWRHIYELLQAGKSHYTELKNICVWNKSNGGMGSLYRSKHEMVAVLKVVRKRIPIISSLGSMDVIARMYGIMIILGLSLVQHIPINIRAMVVIRCVITRIGI